MALISRQEALSAGRRVVYNSSVTARDLLIKSASAAPQQKFDVFLSHSIHDAETILGVRAILQADGLSVYVDWIDDPQLDRRSVSRATANVLRERMKKCSSLIFVTSDSSPTSKWMPWELGFFDGMQGPRIAIMPLEDSTPGSQGQEYLELYPAVERLPSTLAGHSALFAVRGTYYREYLSLKELAAGSQTFRRT
ncbi:toll/interleukin-1 receptor domain-containing protein [Rhodococcus qingshengii]|uniref:toll/interleukin-1 receptor domain-containing protein n=1 Tax=Rhodococcus qingshengii TaxID=334542 RepID=UPI0002B7E0E1|nr:toll/interleukin-1 receptor domain-containing protein [Rhodococcus qingshengii]EME14867.1 hypothetical protein G418_29507 [Rhodococcus qingshengii BKS 20-40]